MTTFNLKGKNAFVAGIGDDQGFGWAIAKALYAAGAKVFIGTWVPVMNIFTLGLKNGKFDCSTPSGDFVPEKVYPLDVGFDSSQDIPQK